MKFQEYFNKVNQGILTVEQIKINTLIDELNSRIDTNRQIHLIGNGGSAANCYHIIGDYIKSFTLLNKRINIKCYSDNSCYISAAANDLDYSLIYEILIGNQIQEGDLIIFFSGSGNSLNLIKACLKAKKFNIATTAITGYAGGELGKIVDNHLYSRIDDMEVCEDIQLMLFHYIKQQLIQKFQFENLNSEDLNNSKRYKKRTEMGEIA